MKAKKAKKVRTQQKQKQKQSITQLKHERISIFAKLISTNILIGVLPMLVVALIILQVATKGLLNEVEEANVALTAETSKNMDMMLSSLADTSNLMITDTEMVTVASKNADDYDSLFTFDKERKDVIDSRFASLSITHPQVNNMMFVKEDEVIASAVTPYYQKEEFRSELFSSEEYSLLSSSKKNILWYYDKYERDSLFLLRKVRLGVREIGVFLMDIDKDYLMNRFRG
ncbi:MAG: cache domain-containing protein, partial [Vallitaleaceae bacterium]|nr:cache domain-containing protein [Vallitaleaceae bacterium]